MPRYDWNLVFDCHDPHALASFWLIALADYDFPGSDPDGPVGSPPAGSRNRSLPMADRTQNPGNTDPPDPNQPQRIDQGGQGQIAHPHEHHGPGTGQGSDGNAGYTQDQGAGGRPGRPRRTPRAGGRRATRAA
jgi:hypothetical protein